MRVYQLRPDSDRFQWLTMADERDFSVEIYFQGEPIRSIWSPKRVDPIMEESQKDGLGDYPTLGSIPTFSRRAIDVLKPFLERNGELLPLVSSVGQFFAYNITNMVKALDEERSELTRFRSSGRVMRIDRYEFNSSIESEVVFKLPQLPGGRPLVTTPFVEAVTASQLQGFVFDELWRSD